MTLKPFSESINLESTELQKPDPVVLIASENVKADDASENKYFLKPFSENIYGGPGSGHFEHEGRPGKVGGSIVSDPGEGGYNQKQVNFLMAQGLRPYEIKTLNKAQFRGPPDGYTRENRFQDLPEGSILWKLCKMYGFVDFSIGTNRADPNIFPMVFDPEKEIKTLPEGKRISAEEGLKEHLWRSEYYRIAVLLGVATDKDKERVEEGKDISDATWDNEVWPVIDTMQHDPGDLTPDQIEALREIWPKKIEKLLRNL